MAVEQNGRECRAMDKAKPCRRGGGGGTLLGIAAMTDTGKITLNYVSPHARFQGVSKALILLRQ
jgi:hypothetical protein